MDYALQKYQFFACSTCHQPYFGGLRECGAAQQPMAAAAAAPAASYDASELVCGSCSALKAGKNCQEHGVAFIEYKCK